MEKHFEPVTVKQAEATEKQIHVIGQAIRNFNHTIEDQTKTIQTRLKH